MYAEIPLPLLIDLIDDVSDFAASRSWCKESERAWREKMLTQAKEYLARALAKENA